MQARPEEELRSALSLASGEDHMDNATALRLKRNLAEEFRAQLCVGVPNDEDEQGLRRLAKQIRSKKVVVKLFVKHQLHAKLYLLFRPAQNNPITGFLGSSNLTFAGLSKQGELNVDVLSTMPPGNSPSGLKTVGPTVGVWIFRKNSPRLSRPVGRVKHPSRLITSIFGWPTAFPRTPAMD
jgi:hypothetical protein